MEPVRAPANLADLVECLRTGGKIPDGPFACDFKGLSAHMDENFGKQAGAPTLVIDIEPEYVDAWTVICALLTLSVTAAAREGKFRVVATFHDATAVNQWPMKSNSLVQ